MRFFFYVIPVVEQDVGCPHLLGGEAKVLHAWMLALVPLEIVVEPALCGAETVSNRGNHRPSGFMRGLLSRFASLCLMCEEQSHVKMKTACFFFFMHC